MFGGERALELRDERRDFIGDLAEFFQVFRANADRARAAHATSPPPHGRSNDASNPSRSHELCSPA